MNRKSFVTLGLLLLVVLPSSAQTGVKRKRPLPYEFGRVTINNYSQKANLAPVVFEHWIHRAKFTCKVCHVDVGFAMKAQATGITALDNQRGYYCGACHNGKTVNGGKAVFDSCAQKVTEQNEARCKRCHSLGKQVESEYDFFQFVQRLPREQFGNGVDWEKAEQLGLIKPVVVLEGFTAKRQSFAVQKDFALNPSIEGMPNIIFSHSKHTVWNGCELCHPEIFGVKKGAAKYTMVDISEGKSCGACHTTVAFPLVSCQRCHSTPVQR